MFEREDQQNVVTDWTWVKEKGKKIIGCVTGIGECERKREKEKGRNKGERKGGREEGKKEDG